jgi:spectinomycin phosphotransferase
MRAVPEGVDERDLVGALRDGWGLDVTGVEYVPVGGGTHHWTAVDGAARRHWVNVDDLDGKDWLGQTRDSVFDALRRTHDTARALRDAGLEFISAPVPASTGEAMLRLNDRYSVAVFPFLRGRAGEFDDRLGPAERDELVDLLVRMHAATPKVAGLARVVPPAFSRRRGLEAALADLDRPWDTGPYGEPARALMVEHADGVRRLIAAFDPLAGQVVADTAGLVLTHGEPHPGNLFRAGGRLYLIDWDTVGLAPPERDLWMVPDGAQRYAEASGRPVDEDAIRLYRLRWLLDDIATTVSIFHAPHGQDGDTELSWRWLRGNLTAELIS